MSRRPFGAAWLIACRPIGSRGETHDMLAQYCRHVISSRHVADLIEMLTAQEVFAAKDYDRLLKMQEREGRAMSALATRMRLSQQSTYSKDRKKGTLVKKPHLM